jgi:hypothetical protein
MDLDPRAVLVQNLDPAIQLSCESRDQLAAEAALY